MLERRLDNHNYEGLTKSTKRKGEVSITDATVDTDISSDNDTIDDDDDNHNNTSNERIDHGLQSTYGDRNELQIKYGDDDHKIDISNQFVLANRNPIFKSYKDRYSNNIITHGSNTITHGRNIISHGNTAPISSK